MTEYGQKLWGWLFQVNNQGSFVRSFYADFISISLTHTVFMRTDNVIYKRSIFGSGIGR